MAITAGTAILAGSALGALSGLFADKNKKTSTQVEFPKEFQGVAEQTGNITENVQQRPGQFWTGQRSAGPSAMRLASFGKAADIGTGSDSGRMGALMDIAGQQGNINTAMSGLSADEVEGRMNPYSEGWIAQTLAAGDRGNEQRRSRRAAMRSGMPGSRGLLAEGQADASYGRERDLNLATMNKGAYERSEDVLERERQRLGSFDIQNRQLSGTLANYASNQESQAQSRDLQRMAALRNAGAEQEGFQQNQINDNMDLFDEVRGYPESRAAFGAGVLSGVPTGQSTTAPTGRNIGSSVLGGALTVAGLGLPGGGTVGGAAIKGLGFEGASGGRIRRQHGGIGEPNPEMVMRLIETFQQEGRPIPPELQEAAASMMQGPPPMPLPMTRPAGVVPPMPAPTTVAARPTVGALGASMGDPRTQAAAPGPGALTAAALPAVSPAVPQPATYPGTVMGALGKYLEGRSDPNDPNSQTNMMKIGLHLLQRGGGSPDGVDRGIGAHIGEAMTGIEGQRAASVKSKKAYDLSREDLGTKRGIARAQLRAKELQAEIARTDKLAAQAAKEENWEEQNRLRQESIKSIAGERERRAEDREAQKISFTPDKILTLEGLPDINLRSLANMSPADQAVRREKNITGIEAATEKLQTALESSRISTKAAEKYIELLDSKGYVPSWADRQIASWGVAGLFGDDDLRLLESISATLTPAMRQGMPGAASDRDVAMFRAATIGANNTVGNNRAIAKAMIETRKLREAKLDFMASVAGSYTGGTSAREAERAWNNYLNSGYADVIDHARSTRDNIVASDNRIGWRDYFNKVRDGTLPATAAADTTAKPPTAAVGKKTGATLER